MANVPRPLVALLVATLAFFALWTVALKPSASNGGGGSQGPSGPASAVAKAHRVAAASAAASAAESGAGAPQSGAPGTQSTKPAPQSGSTALHAAAGSATTATGLPATTTPTPANPRGATPSQAALSGNPATSPTGRAATGGSGAAVGSSATGATGANTGPAALKAALSAHEVVVMLFYNPAGADDQAVKQELDALYPSSGALVLSAPIAQLAAYSSITGRLPVSQAPTLLFIDRHGNASEVVGFADDLEIAQRLAATLAVK
jgi:hypothetical protein